MAKAKQLEEAHSGPVLICCPACGSSIASDGKMLHSKGKRFLELEEIESGMGEVNEALAKAEKRIQALEEENVKLKEKPAHVSMEEEDPDREFE